MFLESCYRAFSSVDLVIVGGGKWMSMLLVLIWASTAFDYLLSMMFIVGAYPRLLRAVKIFLKAAFIAPSLLE